MHYVNLCEEHGIKNIRHSLDEMLVIDYIVAMKTGISIISV